MTPFFSQHKYRFKKFLHLLFVELATKNVPFCGNRQNKSYFFFITTPAGTKPFLFFYVEFPSMYD